MNFTITVLGQLVFLILNVPRGELGELGERDYGLLIFLVYSLPFHIFGAIILILLQCLQKSGQCIGSTAKKNGEGQDVTVPLPSMATIVIETGVQNTVLAMAIMTLSFSSTATSHQYFRMQLLVILWGIVVSFEASIVMCIFRYKIMNKTKSINTSSSVTDIGIETISDMHGKDKGICGGA